jgi:hypothetical protein
VSLSDDEKKRLRTEWKIRNFAKHYSRPISFPDLLMTSLTGKYYEPVQRNKDGKRWIRHRFPIKGGISLRDIMVRQVTATNTLLAHFRQGEKDDTS